MPIALAPAKINLGLTVACRRADGYHDIDTIFAAIDFTDELTFEMRNDGEIVVDVIGQSISREENLVYRAAISLKKYADETSGISIILKKNIPAGAGLGGGSSDAATTLRTLNEMWKTNLSNDELEAIGATLGADVPFFIRGGVQRGQGRGERLTPHTLSNNVPRHALIILPDIHIDTAWAYGEVSMSRHLEVSTTSDRRNFTNDFEAVVFPHHPELAAMRDAMRMAGASHAAMSGSGSSLFGLFATEEIRDAAQASLIKCLPSSVRIVAADMQTEMKDV